MVVLLLLLGVLVLAICLYVRFLHSPNIEKFAKNLDVDYVEKEKPIKTTIKEVEGIKDGLSKKATKNREQAKNLEDESSTIDSYLDSDKDIKKEDC